MGSLYAAFQHAFRQNEEPSWRLVKNAVSDPLHGDTDAHVNVNYHDATRHGLMEIEAVEPDAFSILEYTEPKSSLGQLRFTVTAEYETLPPLNPASPHPFRPTVRVVCKSDVRTATTSPTQIQANILITDVDETS